VQSIGYQNVIGTIVASGTSHRVAMALLVSTDDAKDNITISIHTNPPRALTTENVAIHSNRSLPQFSMTDVGTEEEDGPIFLMIKVKIQSNITIPYNIVRI
jgi:hypothetical protein